MDLTRLYNLTTPELRDEAERLGVDDTYAMSRGQLIHAIRERTGGSPPSEGLLGKVIGFAKWALQTTAAAALEERDHDAVLPEKEPASIDGSSSMAIGAGAPGVAGAVSETAAGAAAAPGTERQGSARQGVAAVPRGPGDSGGASAAPSGPPGRPPVGVFSRSAGMFEEPFPTRTMARILAEQGHFKRSLAIYASLLREEPADRELCTEADEVRARARRSHLH
jgi:hypothetical protein